LSISKTDYNKLNAFLNDTTFDMIDIVKINLDFLIDPSYREFIFEFQKNLKFFINSVDEIKESISEEKYIVGLTQHGLFGDELQRKLNLYYKAREQYYDARKEFYNAGIDFWEMNKEIPSKKLEGVTDFKKRIVNVGKKIDEKFRSTYNKFKEKTGALTDFIDLILDSIASVVPGFGLVTEFKKSAELAIKKREHYSYKKLKNNLTPELIARMKKHYTDEPMPAQ